jgi:hypothetical protein
MICLFRRWELAAQLENHCDANCQSTRQQTPVPLSGVRRRPTSAFDK